MQWMMEKEVVTNNKNELEEKYSHLQQKQTTLKNESDVRKPPINAKVKDATKFAIKDLMKNNTGSTLNNVLNKNILNKTNKFNLNMSNMSEEQPEEDSSRGRDSFNETKEKLGVNVSKRLAHITKSPSAKNKFKFNLFEEDKGKENSNV